MGYPSSHLPLSEQIIRVENVICNAFGPQNAPLSAGQALSLFIRIPNLATANPSMEYTGASPYNLQTASVPALTNIGLIVCRIAAPFGVAASAEIGWINTSENSDGSTFRGFAPNIDSGIRRTRYRIMNVTSQEFKFIHHTNLREYTTTALNYFGAAGPAMVTSGGTAGIDYANNGTSQVGNLAIGQLVDPTITQDDYIEFERWEFASTGDSYWAEIDGMNYQDN